MPFLSYYWHDFWVFVKERRVEIALEIVSLTFQDINEDGLNNVMSSAVS